MSAFSNIDYEMPTLLNNISNRIWDEKSLENRLDSLAASIHYFPKTRLTGKLFYQVYGYHLDDALKATKPR